MIRNSIIDTHGKFKYISIEIFDSISGQTRTVIRGQRWVFDDHEMFRLFTQEELQRVPPETRENWVVTCKGGGMIIHTVRPDIKDIVVYGYSIPFGKGDHQKTHYVLA